MAYWDVASLAADQDYAQRCMAAYATEVLGDSAAVEPPIWWSSNCWNMAAAPGFGDAYASALASNNPNPGRDPSVIPDSSILAAVQAL
jgi:hypothetical protein